MMADYKTILPGDPGPGFFARTAQNPRFAFDTAAGRFMVLCLFGSAGSPHGRTALDLTARRRDLFNDDRIALFGVSVDPDDEALERVADSIPGIRIFWDFDGAVSRLYGALPADGEAGVAVEYRPAWIVLDPTMRVAATFPIREDGSEQPALEGFLDRLPAPELHAGVPLMAPVLYLPNVFEPHLCASLIAAYRTHGGEESGFMRQIDGKTVGIKDHSHKHRRDYTITEPDLIKATQARVLRRIVPEIQKVHQFKVTRMERYIVACYDAENRSHFRRHRDNTTTGTAHRRFAVSINLNSDFDGGEISFPEYGPRRFKPPPGAAVVFSCSLLHEVSPMTKGERFVFLPFLYDDEAARIREANNPTLAEELGTYSAG